MKFFLAILAALISISVGGCGAGSEADQQDKDLQADIAKYLAAPEVDIPEGPPPKKVVFKDLKEGSGTVAKRGDKVLVYFRGFNYRTGMEYCFEWRPRPPVPYSRLARTPEEPGLQQAIVGMEEGARREVIVPANLNGTDDALVYVVELASVEPADKSAPNV